MTYDQWKTRSPDDEWGRYLCGGHLRECGNTVSVPHDICEECLEELAAEEAIAEEAMVEFYQWEPVSAREAPSDRRKVHAGVTAVVVSAVDRHPGLAPINGSQAMLDREV